MAPLKPFVIAIWILLPTVMFGGFSLLGLITAEKLTPFRMQFFRAGHGHAGVLLVMALVYCFSMGATTAGDGFKRLGAGVLLAGILMQSGGFFLHMGIGEPGARSPGIYLTWAGTALLVVALGMLVYALATRWTPAA